MDQRWDATAQLNVSSYTLEHGLPLLWNMLLYPNPYTGFIRLHPYISRIRVSGGQLSLASTTNNI